MIIANGEALKKIVAAIIEDYNNRPHGSLNGLTPYEEYVLGAVAIPKKFTEHQKQRQEYNKNFCCKNTT